MESYWWAQPSDVIQEENNIRGEYTISYGVSNSHTSLVPRQLEQNLLSLTKASATLYYNGKFVIEIEVVEDKKIVLDTTISFYHISVPVLDPSTGKLAVTWADDGGRVNVIRFEDEEQRFNFIDDSELVLRLASHEDEWKKIMLPNLKEETVPELLQILSLNASKDSLRSDLSCFRLLENDYLKQITFLYQQTEINEHKEVLVNLSQLLGIIFALNQRAIFRRLFQDDIVFSVVRCLEEFVIRHSTELLPATKFLSGSTKFHSVLNFPESIKRKIHMKYRIDYCLKECLAKISGDYSELEVLSTNLREDIVTFIIEHNQNLFGKKIIKELLTESIPEARKLELLRFILEFCDMCCDGLDDGRLLQTDVLSTLEYTISLDNEEIQSTSVQILHKLQGFSLGLGAGHIQHHCHLKFQISEPNLIEILISRIGDVGVSLKIRAELAELLLSLSEFQSDCFEDSSGYLIIQSKFHHLVAPFFKLSEEDLLNMDSNAYAETIEIPLKLLTKWVQSESVISTVIANDILGVDNLMERFLFLLKSWNGLILSDTVDLIKAFIIISKRNRYALSALKKGDWFLPLLKILMGSHCNAVNSKIKDALSSLIELKHYRLIKNIFKNHNWNALMHLDVMKDLRKIFISECCGKVELEDIKERKRHQSKPIPVNTQKCSRIKLTYHIV